MLYRLRQFAALPTGERSLLLGSLAVVAGARLALWMLPFQILRRLMDRFAVPRLAVHRDARQAFSVKRMAWSIQAAARRVPYASCLTQALALHWRLARAGQKSVVCIGVAKGETERLDAHAWLEHEGRILVGDDGQLARYAPIARLGTS